MPKLPVSSYSLAVHFSTNHPLPDLTYLPPRLSWGS